MQKPPLSTLDKLILALAFLLANLRALVFIHLFPDTSTLLGPAWIEIGLWVLAAAGVIYLLVREGLAGEYLSSWRSNWPVALFVSLAFLSLLWTTSPVSTLFRSLELFFATLVASYFGMRLRQEELLDSLFWFGAMILILSIALAQGAPPTGTMYWNPFNGAWRGVFWHRNHLGSIAALLNIMYLVRFLVAMREGRNQGLLDGILYLLSLVVIYFTRSATAYILLIVLHGTLFLAWLWLKISHRLRRVHYGFIAGTGLLSAVLVLTNLDFVFGLFNRDVTMTGRVGLWSHLLEIAGRRPWLGHGFGAFWTVDANREEIRRLVGWATQPLIGDNGLLDIYLHLGVIGVLVFVAVLALAVVRAVRYGLLQRSLAGFFPLLVLVYALVANLSFSLFAESEVFVWMLVVVGLFMTQTVIATIGKQSPRIH